MGCAERVAEDAVAAHFLPRMILAIDSDKYRNVLSTELRKIMSGRLGLAASAVGPHELNRDPDA